MFEESLKQLDGLHAIVYCFSLDHDFSKKDLAEIQQLKNLLGPRIIKDYLILLVTDGKQVNFNKEEIHDFDNWVRQRPKKRLKDVLRECKFRCVPFIKGDEIHLKNISKMLLQMVEKNIYRNASHNILNEENTTEHQMLEEGTINKNKNNMTEKQAAGTSVLNSSKNKISPRDKIEQEPEMSNDSFVKKEITNTIDSITEESSPKPSIVIVIFGRDENANMFAENSILLQGKHSLNFNTTQAVASIIEGRHIMVLNTRGLENTNFKNAFNVDSFKIVLGTVFHNPVQHSAIVYVTKDLYENLKDEMNTLEALKNDMPMKDIFKSHGILILTGEDAHKYEPNHEHEDNTKFEQFFAEFGHRIIVFDKTTDRLETKKYQISELLKIIDNLKTH